MRHVVAPPGAVWHHAGYMHDSASPYARKVGGGNGFGVRVGMTCVLVGWLGLRKRDGRGGRSCVEICTKKLTKHA